MKTLLLVLLVALPAHAFKLTPMQAEIDPKSENLSQVFVLENNGKDKVALKFEVTTRSHDVEGKETRTPSKDFTIYPEQMALEASDKRNIRVSYVGPKDVTREIPYRFVVTQLPVKFKQEKKASRLNFLLQYVASLYVSPDKTNSKVELISVERKGDKAVQVTLENTGSAHQLTQAIELTVKEAKQAKPEKILNFGKKSLELFHSDNILPGERRSFLLETREPVPANSLLSGSLTVLND
jgi:fimbrial chaperone protein